MVILLSWEEKPGTVAVGDYCSGTVKGVGYDSKKGKVAIPLGLRQGNQGLWLHVWGSCSWGWSWGLFAEGLVPVALFWVLH